MRRLLLLLVLTAATFSTGCVAAVPLLIYAAKNRQASAQQAAPALAPDAVRLATHAERALQQPRLVAE